MNPADEYIQMIHDSPDAVQSQPGSSPAYEGVAMDHEMPGLAFPSVPFRARKAELILPYYLGREKKFEEHRVNPTRYPLLSRILKASEDIEQEGPQEEDITLTPTGPLGSQIGVGVVGGKYLGVFNTGDEAEKAVKDYCEKNNFWPNIWWVSDHGNVSLYKIQADAESGGREREEQQAANFQKLGIADPQEFGIKYQGQLEQLAAEKDLGMMLGYSFRTNKIEIIGEDKVLLLDYDLKPLHTRDILPMPSGQIEPEAEPAPAEDDAV
jgi:hypothetical protein